MNDRFDSTAALTAFVAAMIVGIFSYLHSNQTYSTAGAAAALVMSGLAGLVCWLLCTLAALPGPLTAICTGLAGHMGAELTRITIHHTGTEHAKH